MKQLVTALSTALILAACSAPEPQSLTPLDSGERFDQDIIARDVSQAIQFPTVSVPGAPRANWEVFEEFRAFLQARFPLMHDQLNPVDLGDGQLLFTWPGTNPDLDPVVFLAHQDVVPVEPGTEDQWSYPPYDGEIADGFVWGRGTLDMKGHLITLMHAVERHLENGSEPERTVYIALGPDEEVGGIGARRAARYLDERGERAWFALDEGGLTILDSPLTGAPAAMIGVAEKGYMTVTVTARARGGHSSTPPRETAISLLARAITAIEENPFEHSLDGGPTRAMLAATAPQLDGIAGFAAANNGLFGPLIQGQLMEQDAARALLGTTIAPTVIEGGVKDNVLPQQAEALINLRLHPRDTIESALAHLRGAVAHLEGVTVEADQWASEAPPVADMEGAAWDLIAGAAAAHAPDGAPVVPFMVTGATDVRAFANTADNLYRYSSARAEMGDAARIHGDDERIRVDDLDEMASFFYTVIDHAAVQDVQN
ncbi:MAG: M20/M25/M40 family metallo-hydrolase [Alphaproteobacteria bacterium]|nr:M20/M25/M40 family metallo-hydrolase [Alphaproteobacteria bacterium]